MIQIRAHLDDGYSSLRIEGHQDQGSRICTIVTTIFETAIAALDLVSAKFPDDVAFEVTEAASGLPDQPQPD